MNKQELTYTENGEASTVNAIAEAHFEPEKLPPENFNINWPKLCAKQIFIFTCRSFFRW